MSIFKDLFDWKNDVENATPDGSPQSDWELYECVPQQDITAYELSALTLILPVNYGSGALHDTYMKKDFAERLNYIQKTLHSFKLDITAQQILRHFQRKEKQGSFSAS